MKSPPYLREHNAHGDLVDVVTRYMEADADECAEDELGQAARAAISQATDTEGKK